MIRLVQYLIIFQTTVTFSQNLSGKVQDAISLEPIPFATVALYNQQILLDGISTNEKGAFKLKLLPNTTHLSVSFIGYNKVDIPIDSIKNPRQLLIPLEIDNNALATVVVNTERSTTNLKIDRKVVNLGADLQQSGATVLEAMDQIAEIQVDLSEGTLSLRGSGNVRVLINGKPTALNATEVLEQIVASSVDRIEIITSPSAKNQADGLSGIVNIILKKDRNEGFNTTINGSVGTKRYGYGLNGNYQTGRFNLRFKGSQTGREMDSKQTINETLSNGLSQTIFTPHDYSGRVKTLASGIDIFINDKNNLSFDVDYTNDFHSFYNNAYYTNISNADDFVYTRNSSHTHVTTNANVNYRKQFKNESHFLEVDYNFTRNKNELPAKDYNEGVFLFQEDTRNNNTLHALALDFAFPLTNKVQIETGASWNKRVLESFKTLSFDLGNSTNGIFDYQEELFGLYAQSKITLGAFNVQAGLRYEFFTSDSQINTTNAATDLKFSNIFPSLHLSYNFKEAHTVNLGYSKRISRPNFHYINPFQAGNQTFQWVANPALKPEFSDNYELNYLFKKKKLNVSTSLFYRHHSAIIVWLYGINDAGLQSISFDNFGTKDTFGAELNATYKLTKFWDTQVSANYYTTDINKAPVVYSTLHQSSIILKNTFKISKIISADITYRHTPKRQNEFNSINPRNRFDVALRGRFLDSRLTANLRVVDVFDNNLMIRNTKTLNAKRQTIWRLQSQTFGVLFNMSYKLFSGTTRDRNRKKRDYDHGGTTD